jgi:hypothetical protein
MKKMTMKSLLLTVLAMVAVCMTSVSLTACGSDGDDNGGGGGNTGEWPTTFSQKVKYDGKEYPIMGVRVVQLVIDGVVFNVIDFTIKNDKYEIIDFMVQVPKASRDKLLDLTKDQRVLDTSIITVVVNNTLAYGDGSFADGSFLRCSFPSQGTMKLIAKGKVLKINNNMVDGVVTPGKSETHTFDIEYSGTYTLIEPK